MIKDHFIKAKIRFQRGVGHISYLLAIVSVYTALKVSITEFPTWFYLLIIPLYLLSMWSIGYIDERIGWSLRETTISRGMTDPDLLKSINKVNK